MARLIQNKATPTLNINNFYGLNIASAGDTQLSLGESGNMYNCYITKDYNIKKADGYKQLITSIAAKSIQGMWYGNINGTNYFLVACNGNIYSFDANSWTDDTTWGTYSSLLTSIGTLTDAPTQFFSFNNKVYMLNSYEYKYWDGTTFGDVVGYIPKIRIGCLPATGTGTEFEAVNILSVSKRLTYNGDGTTKVYKLPATSLTSIGAVIVNGVTQTLTTHYSVSLVNGTVTFVTAPATATDNVEITYTVGTLDKTPITNNRHAFLFGTAEDNRVFLYGNKTNINKRVFSSLANGVPSAEYFIEASVEDIGSSSYAITGMEKINNMMLIHTNKPETYYSYYDSVDLDGVTTVTFPTPIINESRGNVAMGQTQILNNYPFTIDSQILKWTPTTLKDERNAYSVSKRIQRDLDNITLSNCLTIDYQQRSEMWVSNGKKVWIYNYDLQSPLKQQGVYSRLYINDTPTCWIEINNQLFFGTTDGRVMAFSNEYLTYNGTDISSHWEMNMYDFGSTTLLKTLNKSWIVLSPQPKTSVDIQYITDKNAYSTVQTITSSIATFDDTNFADFTFITNYNPQTFYIRLKAKKFTYIKLIIDNDSSDETFSILSLSLKAEYGSEKK